MNPIIQDLADLFDGRVPTDAADYKDTMTQIDNLVHRARHMVARANGDDICPHCIKPQRFVAELKVKEADEEFDAWFEDLVERGVVRMTLRQLRDKIKSIKEVL